VTASIAPRSSALDTSQVSPDEAAALVPSGSTVLLGGFGEVGVPLSLVAALARSRAEDLTIVANNAGSGTGGLAALIATGRVRRIVCSFPRSGPDSPFAEAYRAGRIALELVPQGTLAERLRAGASGIGPFFCPVGAGTPFSRGKEERDVGGRRHVLEEPIRGDVALVRAHVGDVRGNLAYRATARNFNPVMAMAAPLTIAEVGRMLPAGDFLDPDAVVTPGIFVDRIVEGPAEGSIP
jgi:3-oxoadipate CoA-transferase, alpha subunit